MNRIAWRFKSELVATALVVALAGVGFVNAQDSASTTLTGQDYEEIKALYARYNQGSDFRDAELFLSAFAEDAVMTRGGGDIVGMDALRADRAERYQGKTGDVGRRHMNDRRWCRSASLLPTARCYCTTSDDDIVWLLRGCFRAHH